MIVYRLTENIDKERPCFVELMNAEARIRHIRKVRGEPSLMAVEGEDYTVEERTSPLVEKATALVLDAMDCLSDMYMNDADLPQDFDFMESPLKEAYWMLAGRLDDERLA